jgi:chemotaxis methyl-accepting protein methylase
VLCRNLVFTYFTEELQLEVGAPLGRALRPGGALVVGSHETPPVDGLEAWLPARGMWRRTSRPLG